MLTKQTISWFSTDIYYDYCLKWVPKHCRNEKFQLPKTKFLTQRGYPWHRACIVKKQAEQGTTTMKHHQRFFLHLENSYLGTLPVKLLSLDDDDDDDPGLWSVFIPRVSVALLWGFSPFSFGFFFSLSLSSLPSPKMSSTCQRVESQCILYQTIIYQSSIIIGLLLNH